MGSRDSDTHLCTRTVKMKGKLIKGKAICTDCKKECHIGGKEMVLAYYQNGTEKLCRNCGKIKRVI